MKKEIVKIAINCKKNKYLTRICYVCLALDVHIVFNLSIRKGEKMTV